MSGTPSNKSTIGTRIQHAIERAKDRGDIASVRDVARLIEVSASTLQSMQRPTYSRPRDINPLRKLAVLLGVSLEWLLSGEEDKGGAAASSSLPATTAISTPNDTSHLAHLLSELAAAGLVVMSVESMAKLIREVKS